MTTPVFQPPPTQSPVVIQVSEDMWAFNPIWTKWFIDLIAVITNSGGGSGVIQHNSLGGLQGGTTDEYYHFTASQHAFWAGLVVPDTSAHFLRGDGTWSDHLTGAFTVDGTATFNGNVAIGNSASDTLTIAASAVTWSGNPTHSGNHTFSSNVTVQGTTTLSGGVVLSGAVSVIDNNFSILDNGDNTKVAKFEASGITTGTTRTFTFPDANTTLVGTDATQTLTNKSLTSPTITGTPTATGATWGDLGSVTTIDINGGTIDGTAIGSSSTTTGKFTVVTATTRVDSGAAGDLTLATNSGTSQALIKHVASATRTVNLSGSNGANPSISASAGNLAIGSGWTASGQTCADLGTVTTADINGGTVDGTTIGASSATTGKFTVATVTTRVDSGGASTLNLATNNGVVQVNVLHTAGTSRFITLVGADSSHSPVVSTNDGNLRLSSTGGSVVIGNSSANLIFATDNNNDIGASGANRPRDFYLARDALVGGTLGVTGVTSLAAGAVGAPGLYLAADTTTGLYRIGANNLGITVSGSKVVDIASTGVAVTGTLTFTSGQLALARGGTHADLSATGGANQVLQQSSSGADITVGTLDAASIASGTMATARLGSGTADTRSFLRGDQSWARSWNLIAKSSNQSKTSDTSRAADSELVLSVAANKTYVIRIVVYIDYGAGGLKYRFTGPASPTSIKFLSFFINDAAATTLFPGYTEAFPGSDTVITTGTSSAFFVDVILQNGANAGTFAFEWAQNSSNVAATTVLKGSSLMYSQVDA